MKKTKFIYFFRGSLASHVGIYKSWVDLARDNNQPMEMFTVIDFKTYFQQIEKVNYYKKNKCIKILISPHRFFNSIISFIYFLLLSIKYQRIVIHLRKQEPRIIDKLKKYFNNKIQYIIEIEGDFESEVEYLKQHPYKVGFYNDIFEVANDSIKAMKYKLRKADHILVVTENLKDIFTKRYSELDLNEKISVIPTGADANKFFYNENLREKYRNHLMISDKFVFIFIGNVYYSWQNLKRTLEVFKLIRDKELANNPFLMLLIRRQDYGIAREFIEKVGLEKKDFLLTNVNHDEVNAYLNASDVGVLFRDDHIMNNVASPGKLGEYLSAGLPVLISKGIANYSEQVKSGGFGVVLNDFYDDNEILTKITRLLNDTKRNERSKWAKNIFSVQAYKDVYINLLKSLSN